MGSYYLMCSMHTADVAPACMSSAGLHGVQVPKEDPPNIPPELMASLNISAEVCFARHTSIPLAVILGDAPSSRSC